MPVQRCRRVSATGLGLVLALAMAGCLQDPGGGSGGGVAGLKGYVDNASTDGDNKVTVLGAFGGAEKEAFLASIKDFEQDSGIDVQYTDDQDFTTTVKQKVVSGDSPDIAFFPQPGGLFELASQGYVQPIDTFLDYNSLKRTLIPGFLDSANYNGRIYGAPMRMAVKSIVWYPKQAWEQGGYPEQPASIQELQQVADRIKASGIEPWCMGWESDQATGWVGTDWIEEYVLRMWGPDVYDQWVAHDIPFDDERIVKAFDEFGKIARDDQVFGGTKAILNTSFGDAMNPAFRDNPKCLMHRQGNFADSFYPKDVSADLDNRVGIFVFPPFEGGFEGQPILGGGDLAALFNGNDEDAIEVMKFFTSDKFGAQWAQAGGWLSPHKTFDASNYPNETTRRIAELATSADVFRYDGSDVMPKAVGSGTFWTGMVEWVDGESSSKVTGKIESEWPES